MKKKIIINHISKTEGHSSFEGVLYKGEMQQAKYFSKEGARLIEGLLVGHYFEDAPIITSRICGVCPIVHNTVSVKALETAFNVKVPLEVHKARKLMMIGEFLCSHLLHNYFFSLPDLLGFADDFDMMKKYPKNTKNAMQVRGFGSSLISLFGGRSIHPIANEIGGFRVWASVENIKKAIIEQEQALKSIKEIIPLYQRLDYPKFERKTEYICLNNKKEYSIYDGKMVSTEDLNISVKEFNNTIQETQRGNEVVKHTLFKGTSYFMGALSRINNNFDYLKPESKKLWKSFSKQKVTINPFMNIPAQLVEMLDCIIVARDLLEYLLKCKQPKLISFKPIASFGVAAIEAPRGTLLHYYKINKEGIIEDCNIVTPTAQFLSSIEDDLKGYSKELNKLSSVNREKRIKTLIRAYDPCISCATH